MKRERLYFSGTRRRATSYVGVQTELEERLEGQPTVISRFAIIASDGQGQRYELNRPDSFWRSFSEIDLADRRQGLTSSSAMAARSACLAPSHPTMH